MGELQKDRRGRLCSSEDPFMLGHQGHHSQMKKLDKVRKKRPPSHRETKVDMSERS